MLQPVEQPGQTDSVDSRNQTRILKRKSWDSSAPTGHTSARLPGVVVGDGAVLEGRDLHVVAAFSGTP